MAVLEQQPERFTEVPVQWNQPPAQSQWVRLILPGITEGQLRFDSPQGGILSNLVEAVVFESLEVGGLELLTYPGRFHQEYLLRPIVEPDLLDAETPEGLIQSFRRTAAPNKERVEQLEAEGISHLAAVLVDHALAALIDRIGIAVVRPDFTPLGATPMLTTRLVSTTDTCLELGGKEYRSPFAEHLKSLRLSKRSHLTRTVILRSSGPDSDGPQTARVEQQVALAGPTVRSLYPDEAAPLLAHGLDQHDLESVYEPAELRSNMALLAETETTTRVTEPEHHGTVILPSGSGDAATLQAARRTTVASDEYEWLLGRLSDPGPLRSAYATLGVHPTVEVSADDLTAILGLLPNYKCNGSFSGYSLAREPPVLERVHLVRAAGGTNEDVLYRRDEGAERAWPQAAADLPWVAPSDRDRARSAIQRLRERGEEITTDAEPFPPAAFMRKPQALDHSELVVVGTPETVSYGDLLVGAEHMLTTLGGGATLVTDTMASARQFCAALEQPFVQSAGTWTELYQQTARHWIVNGGVLLVEAGQSVRWLVSPEGNLKMTIDGTAATIGQITDASLRPPRSLPLYACLPSRTAAETYGVFDSSGDRLKVTCSIPEVAETYKPIGLPAIPTRVTYRPAVTVCTMTDGRLHRVHPRQQTTVDPQAALTNMLRTFLQTFTADVTDGTVSVETMTRRLKRWLHVQLPGPLPTASDIEGALDKISFSPYVRKISEEAGVRTGYLTSGLGSSATTIDDVRWRYPLLDEQPAAAHTMPATEETETLAHRLHTEHR